MPADLHLHTHYSDGTYTPVELAREAARAGLGSIALTDHDTTEGCAETAEACASHGIEFIVGTELTSEHHGHELHILGYGFDVKHEKLQTVLQRCQETRQHRIVEMVDRIRALGLPLESEAVFRLANCRSPGRPHVGRALVQAGICATMDEAFERFLKKGKPAWVPKLKMSAHEAINLLHEAGGLAVAAHPGLNRHDGLLNDLAGQGLDGVECFHSRHTPSDTGRFLGFAAERRLLVTGGSDCHGMSKGRPLIGSVRLADEYFHPFRERLRALAARR